MKYGGYLTGPFGQSQGLYEIRNEAKRGRGSQEQVDKKINEDTATIIVAQEGLDFVIDPLFKNYHLFQGFIENVPGVSEGSQENWFNNNVFYRKPRIDLESLEHRPFIDTSYLSMMPAGKAMAIIPSPYTLFMLSDILNGESSSEAVIKLSDLVAKEANRLVSLGVSRIQYDEPVIAYKSSLGSLSDTDIQLLFDAMDICGRVTGASTVLSTYFGDISKLISKLSGVNTDCFGVDLTETNPRSFDNINFNGERDIAIGILDSRNTSLENIDQIKKAVLEIQERCNPARIWITPNTATEYRGWTHGMNKLKILKSIIGELRQ